MATTKRRPLQPRIWRSIGPLARLAQKKNSKCTHREAGSGDEPFCCSSAPPHRCERELQTSEPTDRGRGYVWLATFSVLDVFARVGGRFFLGALLRARG